MLKSKNIEDYIEVGISDIRPEDPITFDVYLYFVRNRHVMLWRQNGEAISTAFLEKYRSRGLEKVWIHQSEVEKFQRYVHPVLGEELPADPIPPPPQEPPPPEITEETPEAAPPEPAQVAAPEPIQAQPEPPVPAAPPVMPQTVQGAKMIAMLEKKDIPEKRKAAMVAKEARSLLNQVATAENVSSQLKANVEVKKVIHDVLDHSVSEAGDLVAEIWNLSNIDPDLEHAVNVATYVVIFAMAFGRIDQALIGDLALAGLLHDAGLSQIPTGVTSTPWKSLTPQQMDTYSYHVRAGLELIEQYSPEVPERVRAIILQHHEKFDGTGYPQRLEGFRVDDVSQLLSIADVLDSISSGQWDGKQRTLKDTLETLESLEKVRAFPEYFNPEVFDAIMRWSRTTDAKNSAQTAIKAVEDQSKGLIQDTARSAGLASSRAKA